MGRKRRSGIAGDCPECGVFTVYGRCPAHDGFDHGEYRPCAGCGVKTTWQELGSALHPGCGGFKPPKND